jgi:hypothetical protein
VSVEVYIADLDESMLVTTNVTVSVEVTASLCESATGMEISSTKRTIPVIFFLQYSSIYE